jgi:hypothetical protein
VINWPGQEAGLSSTFILKVKNAQNCTSTYFTPEAHSLLLN